MVKLSSCILLLISSLATNVYGQGDCSNQCPPLNNGQVVPSLCEGDFANVFANIQKKYTVCHPLSANNIVKEFRMEDFRGKGQVTVIANYYTGCNAGRRESGVFAHVAQRFYNKYGGRTNFIQSVKGGGTCFQWANRWFADAKSLYPESNVEPKEMPISVNDINYEIRDDFFTSPFMHPSYVILDGDLRVRHKFIGPCCGYESYYDCTADTARNLDTDLTRYIESILAETLSDSNPPTKPPTVSKSTSSPTPSAQSDNEQPTTLGGCEIEQYSEWSACSITCGTNAGEQFRWRNATLNLAGCPSPVEIRPCQPSQKECEDAIQEQYCIKEFGQSWSIETVSRGFNSPRDVAFHPSPGLHLGTYSEGRSFSTTGEEAWVVNGANHSVSIVASLGTEHQTTISRQDRGYYHYMINGTALAFNMVSNSNRSNDRDSFNYWAICNDNLNTYIDTKEANYFMGPTLYNSDPYNRNTVNRLGEQCKKEEPCYFLHSDMLHESPGCIGLAHDPETVTAYGNVYWAFDTTGNRDTGELVRFDFQQPHGPGSMDHSVAAVRRFVEVELKRGDPGVHAGMVVNNARREVYISVPASNKVIVVGADSGTFARSAREEYPIYSNRLPSFEYSIWECVDQKDLFVGIKTPTGLALSPDGLNLFVAERETGKILVYEIASGSLLFSINTNLNTIGGLSLSPVSEILHFVDDETNALYSVQPNVECDNPVKSRVDPDFLTDVSKAKESLGHKFSLIRDYNCTVNPIIPNSTFFDQVHNTSGYADTNPDVQSSAGMDATASQLVNRTDCEIDSELNFDALLLGGYFCHQCLPDQDTICDGSGRCSNVQWRGYTCDNEYNIIRNSEHQIVLQTTNQVDINPSTILLQTGETYRFTVTTDIPICLSLLRNSLKLKMYNRQEQKCASNGPLMLNNIDDDVERVLFLDGEETVLLLSVNQVNNGPFEPQNVDDTKNGVVSFLSTTAVVFACLPVIIIFLIF